METAKGEVRGTARGREVEGGEGRLGNGVEWVPRVLTVEWLASPLVFGPGNTFQKRNVSSPAPVTMVCPSGDMAR